MVQFTKGITELTPEQLEKTVRYTDAQGNLPSTRPVEHYTVIRTVMDLIFTKTGKTPVCGPIYAAESQSMQVMWKGEKDKCPLENYLFQRIICVVKIPFENSQYKPGVAISYTEKGITIGFGLEVSVCSNMTIWGDQLLTTYGDMSDTYDNIIKLLGAWLEDYHELIKDWTERVTLLTARKITMQEADEVLGALLRMAVMANEKSQFKNMGVNVTQVSKIAKEVGELFYKNPDSVNAWDMTNACTHVLKADSSDMTKLFQDNRKVVNYVYDYFIPPVIDEQALVVDESTGEIKEDSGDIQEVQD